MARRAWPVRPWSTNWSSPSGWSRSRSFPVVRDLAVDRSVLFENLKAVKAWVPIDGTYDLGSGPRDVHEDQEGRIRCRAAFPAAAAWKPVRNSTKTPASSARRPFRRCGSFNTHPTGAALKPERLEALMGDGGIQECGYAQNCVEVCPKDIPLTRSISEVGGEVMKQALGDLFRK